MKKGRNEFFHGSDYKQNYEFIKENIGEFKIF